MKSDPRVPVGSMWRAKKNVTVTSRPLSRWRAIDAKAVSWYEIRRGDLVIATGVMPSEARDNDGDERHQEFVSVLIPEKRYVPRVYFNGDSNVLERIA